MNNACGWSDPHTGPWARAESRRTRIDGRRSRHPPQGSDRFAGRDWSIVIPMRLKDSACWAAVLGRDRTCDDAFVYAVRSTGVYCRPSCPSRKPRRAAVLFFDDAGTAERAGFRPCRRCRPSGAPAASASVAKVRLACDIIRANPEERHTLRALASRVGVNVFHLQRLFTALVGISPRAYAEACRLGRLKAALKRGERVTPALYDAGYGSSSRLYERVDAKMGMTPATYRRGGRGIRIAYTIAASPLGRLLVAATDRGVCRVMLGDRDQTLEADLRGEYPKAVIHRSDAALGRSVRALVAHLRGRHPHVELPLDVQATAFQWRVWQQLLTIPYGETRSYSQVAAALGAPTAVRAVAGACAANPVALLIPCHRVVRESGDLGGYRWGIERKRALLAQEQRLVRKPLAPGRTRGKNGSP